METACAFIFRAVAYHSIYFSVARRLGRTLERVRKKVPAELGRKKLLEKSVAWHAYLLMSKPSAFFVQSMKVYKESLRPLCSNPTVSMSSLDAVKRLTSGFESAIN
jgi:hypothetical protein